MPAMPCRFPSSLARKDQTLFRYLGRWVELVHTRSVTNFVPCGKVASLVVHHKDQWFVAIGMQVAELDSLVADNCLPSRAQSCLAGIWFRYLPLGTIFDTQLKRHAWLLVGRWFSVLDLICKHATGVDNGADWIATVNGKHWHALGWIGNSQSLSVLKRTVCFARYAAMGITLSRTNSPMLSGNRWILRVQLAHCRDQTRFARVP